MMASRAPDGGVLETIPLNLNRLHVAVHPPKKRKTCHEGDSGEGKAQCIQIRPHAASLSDSPFILDPIALIPRSHLPFSWLDLSSAFASIQSGSLFAADVPLLENGGSGAAPAPGRSAVLVVRLLADGALYVVERVKRGIYALMKMARGVEEGDVLVLGKGNGINGSFDVGAGAGAANLDVEEEAEGEWWEVARVEEPIGDANYESAKRTKFDVSVVFATAASGGGSGSNDDGNGGNGDGDMRMDDAAPVDSFEATQRQQSQPLPPTLVSEMSFGSDGNALQDSQENGGVGSGAFDLQQSPQDLLDGLRDQYLQALYVSKTSVAYFAKGPLARCRAAFQSAEMESARPADLVAFYRDAILNTKKMDLKYRETLPASIQDAMLCIYEDESTLQKRKRKSKKKTLGKNGLYPEEDGFIRQWWKARAMGEQGALIEVSREAEVKKHVSDLRLRETQLQILLILETLALELEEAKKPDNEKTEEPKDHSKSKAKKPQDLSVMLELHIDRLCIWHAVSFEDTVVPDSAKKDNPLSGKKVESDAVRDFCTEVIIPFYASRLPDKCKSITRKLGVSSSFSSSSSSLKHSQAKKTPREPGASVERQQSQSQKHPRRTFHRVHTDEQNNSSSQKQVPSLHRSNTMPSQVTETKRESMEPSLPILTANVRGGIQKAKRAENREVDLNAVARQHEAKLKKVQLLVDQKKELDAAIHALRKPNRELVAKDIADDADKRAGSGRKPKNPVRNPLGQGVQVAATPKGSRKKDAVVGMPPLPRSLSRSSKPSAALSSSPFGSGGGGNTEPQMIPGSAVRPSSFSAFSVPERLPGSDANQGDIGAVQETPSRRSTQPMPSLLNAEQPSPSISGNLFRVPRRPAPAPASRSTGTGTGTGDMAAPSTPVSSRRVNLHPQSTAGGTKSSMVMETPPKQGPFVSTSTTISDHQQNRTTTTTSSSTTKATENHKPANPPARVFATPVKNKTVDRLSGVSKSNGSGVPVTPEKSIYEQLGWDDDDELAL